MNTIWGFGDSFTFGHGCRPDGPLTEYYNQYKKEGDKVWIEWLGEWRGMKTENRGSCGVSNEYILDSVIDNYNSIESGDIVIIGTTLWGRRDVPVFLDEGKGAVDRWLPMLSIIEVGGEVVGVNTMSVEDRSALIDFQLRFGEHPLWEKRATKRFRFLSEILHRRGIQTLIWNINDEASRRTEKIRDVSQYNDSHFSFGGHKEWAHYLDKRLKGELI
jgi:hypothetical protein